MKKKPAKTPKPKPQSAKVAKKQTNDRCLPTVTSGVPMPKVKPPQKASEKKPKK